MYRVIFVVVFAVAVSAIDKEEFMKHCGKVIMMHQCCKDVPPVSSDIMNNLKECGQMPAGPLSCERDICLATKRGYGTPDGKINNAKAEKDIETILSGAPKILAAVKAHCFNGAYEKTGPPDMCQAKKFNQCAELYVLISCSNWSDEGTCKNSKMEADDCVDFLK